MSQGDGQGYSITGMFVWTAHGEMAGSAAAAQMASVTGKWAKIKAKNDNTGCVYLGLANTVIAGGTSTSALVGYELDAGQEVDVALPGGNLSGIWYISDTTADDLIYFVYS